MRILLDAGHGGYDPGAINPVTGEEEEDFALDIVHAIGALLTQNGHLVMFIRMNNTYMPPLERLRFIRSFEPEAFVSVHCNSLMNPEANGTETIYRDEYDYPLAECIHKALIKATGFRDRGLKSDIKDLGRKLAVLGDYKTPACLVEVGFISNEGDLEVIRNTVLMANAIVEGIEKWESLIQS